MTETKIDIRSGSLFPWHFQFVAGLILLVGIFLLPHKPVMGLLVMLASGYILSAASGTEIDKAGNRYREYTSFYFLLKSGRWKAFPGVEKIFINSAKNNTRLYTAHTVHSSTFMNQQYNGYLKLNDGTKIFLLSGRNKEKLTATLIRAASFLKIKLQDNTELA